MDKKDLKKTRKYSWLLQKKLILPMFVCGLSVLMVGLPGNEQIIDQIASFRHKRSISYRVIAAKEREKREISWKELQKISQNKGSERDIAAQLKGYELKNIYDSFHKRQTSLFERVSIKSRRALEKNLTRDLHQEDL